MYKTNQSSFLNVEYDSSIFLLSYFFNIYDIWRPNVF